MAGELEQYVAELGSEGRLLRLQLEELSAGVEDEERLAVRDHLRPRPGWEVDDVLAELRRLTPEELSDLAAVAKAIDLTGEPEALDAPQVPRGYRLLARVPQLPPSVVERVVERFGSLKVILAVGTEDLEEVEGVGPAGPACSARGSGASPTAPGPTATRDPAYVNQAIYLRLRLYATPRKCYPV